MADLTTDTYSVLLEVIDLQSRTIDLQNQIDASQKARIKILDTSIGAAFRIMESLVAAGSDPETLAKLLRDVDVMLLDIRMNHLS